MSPTPRSPKGWGHRQHGDCLAGLLRVGRYRRAGRPRPVGPAPADRPPRECHRHAQSAAEEVQRRPWPSHMLAGRLGIDHNTVANIRQEYGVAPWRAGIFKFSTDPELVAKVVDVVGFYLAPPENAVVLSLDENQHIQAHERTAPGSPMQPGRRRASTATTGTGPPPCLRPWRSPPATSPRRASLGTSARSSWPSSSRLSEPTPRESAPGDGQLRRAQGPRGKSLAGGEPSVPDALHAELGLVVELG